MKLKELRLNKDKKQDEIAKILNITPGAYSHYETERNEPNINILVKLADYYHVTLDELIGRQVPFILSKVDFSEKQLELIEELKDLSDEECRYLQASIYALKAAKDDKDKIVNKYKNN